MTILEAMHDPALFGPWFKNRNSWSAWEAFLAALFGLPFPDAQAEEVYRRHTGRTMAPAKPVREAWVIVGRRGGKSRIAALTAVYLACFRDYREYLTPGEVGTLAVIAADRRQARNVMRYILGFLQEIPMLRELIVKETQDTIELSNRITIEVHTANYRAVRGYSLIGVICDEIAFWRTDDGSANPDVEILNGLRPGMATIPTAMLLAISSPYARRGALYEAFRKHYGKDGDAVFVWKGATRGMNPAVDPRLIEEAYEEDEAAASAEYGAEFRRDIETFISREAVQACIQDGRSELPPVRGVSYRAFVDPSGGSADSMTLAIAHVEKGRAVLDCVREHKAPFNPNEVVGELVEVLRAYGCETVVGDRYGGEWPRERFREAGIQYKPSDKTKSDLYLEFLPIVNSGKLTLLDNSRLHSQLYSLERRCARGGRDTVDHPPGMHDDLANAAAGAIVLAATWTPDWAIADTASDPAPAKEPRPYQAQMRQMYPELFEENDELTCGECAYRESRRPANEGKSYCSARKFTVHEDDSACDGFVSDDDGDVIDASESGSAHR